MGYGFIFAAFLLISAACATRSGTTQPLTDRSEDLRAFADQFLAADQSYSDATRATALDRFSALEAVAGQMSDAVFELALAEIAALADNGHTMLLPARWATTYNRLALRYLITDEGLYVADAAPGYEHIVGSRVSTVEGRDLEVLRAEWDRFHSGQTGFRDESLYYFIESPEVLHAARIAASPNSVNLGFADGSTATVGVSVDWPNPEGVWAFLPQARQVQLAQAGRIDGDPLYLQAPAAFFRFVELPERNAVYIQFRANVDFSGQVDMSDLCAEAVERLRAIAPQYVIVDQRFNLGGDLNTTRDLMQAIPEIVGGDGQVFAITSGRTFSAGISSLGYLKQAGGDRVVLIGARIGDRLEFWAEGDPIELPQTGSLVALALERHNYMTGCPEDDCHESIRLHPIAVQSLEPDVRPVLTYDDVVSGRDPYLEAAFELIDD